MGLQDLGLWGWGKAPWAPLYFTGAVKRWDGIFVQSLSWDKQPGMTSFQLHSGNNVLSGSGPGPVQTSCPSQPASGGRVFWGEEEMGGPISRLRFLREGSCRLPLRLS